MMPSPAPSSTLRSLACLLPLMLGCSAPVREGPPSVVVICLDTLRRDRLGAYGNTSGLTPNLDRFASQAVVFEDSWAVANETLLSHAALFTSRYATETGPIFDDYALADEAPTLAEVMDVHGYQTGAAVAGGHLMAGFGLGRGFEWYEQGGSWASLYHTVPLATGWLDTREPQDPFLLFVHGYDTHHRYLKPGPFGTSRTERDYLGPGVDAARQKLGTVRVVDGWFLPPDTERVHDLDALRVRGASERVRSVARARDPAVGATPLQPRDLEHITQVYDGAVAYADAWFGLFMAELDQRGLLDETIVVVLSDHGEELGEHGIFGHRYTLTDESLAVPLMVRLPGAAQAGRRVSGLVDLTDVMPTLLDAANAQHPAGIQGRSLWPVLEGAEHQAREAVFAQTMFRAVSVRNDQGRLTFSGIGADSPWLGEMMGTTRLEAPAFVASEGLDKAAQIDLVAKLVTWNHGLRQPKPGDPRAPTAEQKRLIREQGYWRPR